MIARDGFNLTNESCHIDCCIAASALYPAPDSGAPLHPAPPPALCSALFHCRDTRTTERLDYCSAVAVVAAGLAAAMARPLWGRTRRRRVAAVTAVAGVVAGLIAHLRYMLTVKFDYGCVGSVRASTIRGCRDRYNLCS